MPLVSVIIPSYNHEKYVSEAIQSVLDQTYQDFEIIITDDGSTDNTVKKIQKFNDHRIKLFVFKKNQGACVAANNCIRRSRGEYIAMLSSDDVFLPGKLEKQVEFLDMNPDCMAVFSYVTTIDENGDDLSIKDPSYVSPFQQSNRSRFEWLNYFFYNGNGLCHPSVLARKEVYSEFGKLDNRYAQLPDFNLWINVCLKHEIFILPESLVKFRIHSDQSNASGDLPENHLRSSFEHEHLLELFLTIQTKDEFLKIFPEGKKWEGKIDDELIPFYVAMLAVEQDSLFIHKRFGINTLFKLMKNQYLSNKLEGLSLFSYRDLIHLTSTENFIKAAIVDLPSKDLQIQARNQIIQDQKEVIQLKDTHLSSMRSDLNKYQSELIKTITELIKTKSNLDLIAHSKTWRMAEAFRKLIYVYILGKLPLLHNGLQGILPKYITGFMYEKQAHLKTSGDYDSVSLNTDDYKKWINKNIIEEARISEIKKEIAALEYCPKISLIMPVYDIDKKWLLKAIESVINQVYENWELCIVDDASTKNHIKPILEEFSEKDERIKVAYLNDNLGIAGASNKALAMTTGEFIGLLDHDDELTQDALFETVKAINKNCAELIYSDEAIIDDNQNPVSIHFKPDFSPDLLFSHNYITHFLVVKKSLFSGGSGFFPRFDGAQDYDLLLRLTEKTDKIYHIPKVLYYWRSISSSTSFDPEEKTYADGAGKKALQEALERRKIKGDVWETGKKNFYRVKRYVNDQPLISIIIPFKDKSEYLKKCVESILDKSTYQRFEIIGINNISTKKETVSVMRTLTKADNRIHFHDYQIPFNFSKICNHAVTLAKGEHIVLMNNDIEIITLDWIESLLEHSQRKEIGAVGAKLYYSDDTIQHAGVILGIGGFAGHSHRHLGRDESGYHNRLMITQNLSAVTGALLMVEKQKYTEVQGFDEVNFQISLNDVDFCLKLREEGYLNVFTPFCEAYHHESISRGYEDTPEKKKRFHKEILSFQNKWQHVLQKGDPYYNPNLTLDRENFSFNF